VVKLFAGNMPPESTQIPVAMISSDEDAPYIAQEEAENPYPPCVLKKALEDSEAERTQHCLVLEMPKVRACHDPQCVHWKKSHRVTKRATQGRTGAVSLEQLEMAGP